MTRSWVRATASRTDLAITVLQAWVANAVAAALKMAMTAAPHEMSAAAKFGMQLPLAKHS